MWQRQWLGGVGGVRAGGAYNVESHLLPSLPLKEAESLLECGRGGIKADLSTGENWGRKYLERDNNQTLFCLRLKPDILEIPAHSFKLSD